MLYEVISNGEVKAVTVYASQAEVILRSFQSGYIVTVDKAPHNIHVDNTNPDEGQLNEYYEDEAKAEKARKANPCCMNCYKCYEEYGYTLCKVDEMPEDADPDVYHCDKWA